LLSINYIEHLVLFDGECLLCNHSVQFLLRKDTQQKLFFATLKYAKEQGILPSEMIISDSFIYRKYNQFYLESDAVIQVAKTLGGYYAWFSPVWHIPKFIRDIPYRLIAKHRYKLWGKTETCAMMTLAYKKRILDYN